MVSPPAQATKCITVRISWIHYEWMRKKAFEGYRSINRQFGNIIDAAMEAEKAPEHGLENRSDASHHHE